MVSFPYPTVGTITDSEGSNPSGAKVIMRNDRSGEKINTTTNASGQYLLEAANLASGYMTTDRLTIICAYGDEENESSFLISDYPGDHTVNLTLEAISESSDVNYCQVQDVLDELGDKTTDDISYERVRKIILRNEAEIDERSGTKFTSTTVTDEYYDYNQYTTWTSPEGLAFPRRSGYGSYNRGDSMGATFNDSLRLNSYPLLTITSLYKNAAGDYQTDNWDELDEQTGTGGDFIIYKDIGVIQFVNKSPNYGRRQVKISYTYGYSSVPKTVERLCILLSIRDVLISKRNSDSSKSQNSLSVDGFSRGPMGGTATTYQNWLNSEIERLWLVVGDLEMGRA